MKYFALLAGSLLLHTPGANGSIYTISDDRVRNIDITPVLGRGYSIMTNQYHSTCLVVDEVTVPSYNYDYVFNEYSSSSDAESQFSVAASGSGTAIVPMGFLVLGIIQASFSASASSQSKVSTQTHMVTTSMKIERYYSSVREEVSPLSGDAFILLNTEDYVGFFKACGPTYVRGIRRAQEVSTIFTFKSTSKETASQFSASMKVSVTTVGLVNSQSKLSVSSSGSSKFKSQNSSLKIKILGFGMGLTAEGSETLVATSMDDHKKVMQFAFSSMTRNEDSHNIGMVYGIEIVPWVHNTAFQVAAKLGDTVIEIPLPRSLIPRSYRTDGAATPVWNTNNRADFRCKNLGFSKDKYGYCCEISQLYNPTTGSYTGLGADETTHVCKPIRALDPSLIKDNMSNNGEFVARLDSIMRYKLIQVASMEKCISASHAIPIHLELQILKPMDTVKYDGLARTTVTLAELKMAIDPKNDYGLVKNLGRELEEWIEMFYSPCMAALYGTNVGTTPETDVSYFMAYPWYKHSECMKLSCLTTSMRWDRKKPGCVPGVMTGGGAADYVDGEDTYCAKDNENFDADVCKFPQTKMREYQEPLITCWKTLPASTVDYFLTNYCLPQITGVSLDSEQHIQDSVARAAAVAAIRTAKADCATNAVTYGA